MKAGFLVFLVLLGALSFGQVKAEVKTVKTAAAITHQVSLTWTASVSSGVDGYNIYRGTTAGQESATPLNSALIVGTSYVDSTVSAGTSYFYTAKTHCSSCSTNLSIASNEVRADVPPDVLPQPLPPVLNTPVVQ